MYCFHKSALYNGNESQESTRLTPPHCLSYRNHLSDMRLCSEHNLHSTHKYRSIASLSVLQHPKATPPRPNYHSLSESKPNLHTLERGAGVAKSARIAGNLPTVSLTGPPHTFQVPTNHKQSIQCLHSRGHCKERRRTRREARWCCCSTASAELGR